LAEPTLRISSKEAQDKKIGGGHDFGSERALSGKTQVQAIAQEHDIPIEAVEAVADAL
jgi:2-hydroxychromene-2-carboxylate isomerase